MKMNAEKLYRYIYNLLPFPSSPFLNPKTKTVCTFICFTLAFVPDYAKYLLSVFSEQTTSTTPIIRIAN